MNYLDLVRNERQRQLVQGKSEANPNSLWHLVVADQLAMVTREFSLARYAGLKTSPDEPALPAVTRRAIQLGLVRLGACAMAWWDALDREA